MTVKTLTVSGLNVAAQVLGGTGLTSSTTNGVTTLSVSGSQSFSGNVGIGTSSPAGLLHVADATIGGIVVGNNNSSQKGIYFRTTYLTSGATQDYALTVRPNTFQFFKPASTAVDFSRFDYENVGSIDSFNPLWSGVHFGSEALKDTNGSTATYPRVAMYHNYNTVTAAPNNLTFNITPNNAGSVKYSVKIDTANSGNIVLTPQGTGVVAIGANATISTSGSALVVAGNNYSILTTLTSSSTSATYISLTNTSTSGRQYLIGSTGTANGQGAGLFVIWDNTASANRFAISSAGNVGIGTTSPGSQLDVVAQDAFRITGYQPFLTVRDSNSSNRGFRLQTAAGDILFETDASGGGTYAEKMRLSASGNVGIGTTSPNFGLHIQGVDATALMIERAANDTTTTNTYTRGLYIRSGPSTSDWGIAGSTYSDASYTNKAWWTSTGKIAFGAGGRVPNDLIIDTNGNVGIGTTSPAQLLHVAGRTLIGGATTNSIWDINADSMGINRNISTGAIYDTTGHGYQWQHTKSTTAASNNLTLQVYTPAGVSVAGGMSITGAGNVGIGMTDPNATFHTNGTFALTTATSGTANSVILAAANYALPDPTTCSGRIYWVKNTSASAIALTSSGTSKTIDGAASISLSQYDCYTVVSNGTNWFVI